MTWVAVALYAIPATLIAAANIAELGSRRALAVRTVTGALTAGLFWPASLAWCALAARQALRNARSPAVRTARR